MQVGTVEGEVDTTSFSFRAVEDVKKFDFVSVKSNDQWILAQVEEVTKHPDGETVAEANIIGYREKGLTKAPRRVIEPDSIVYEADQDLISDTLGLNEDGLRIGSLETNEDIDIHVNKEDLYKHYAVLAQTGAGKSYLSGVLIEEMLEADIPVLVLDPHGEYNSLKDANTDSEDPKGFDIVEYSPNTDVNSMAEDMEFSSLNLDKKELQTLIPDSLTNSQMGVLYNALKRLKEKDEDYNLNDLMDAVSQEDSTAKWNLLNYLEQLDDSGLFSEDPIDLENLLEPGRASIINLRAVEPENAEMTVYLLMKKLFQLRKRDLVPPFITVIEEAHNYTPEQSFGKAISNDILRKIASEGRKFGLGIGVISQRPARIDKNVLSQANTQFILRVTNPNDLKAISKSFEGVTSEVESMIKSLPPGVAFTLGMEYPVMTDVRIRRSRHGGETQTSEEYEEKRNVEVFEAGRTLNDYREETGKDYQETLYPLFLVETDDKKYLIDGVKAEKKAEKNLVSGMDKTILQKLEEGKSKSEIMDELGVDLSKVSSKIESLKSRELVDDELKPVDSIFDVDLEERRVSEDKLVDFEVSKEKLSQEFDGDVKKIRYPYYAFEETVYDPVLGKEV